MKKYLTMGFALVAAATALVPSVASAQIINIDFIGTRGNEPTPQGASGDPSPFAGGGTVYNDIVANDSLDTDNITVTGTNLVDSNGLATTIGFTIAPVGADNGGLGVFNGSYLFIHSANNVLTSVPFTISGLGSATSVNIAFLTTGDGNVPAVTFNGVAATAIVDNGYQYEFDNVPVTGGTLVGTIGGSNTTPAFLISGLGIQVVSVPEPSTWAMIGLGACLMGYRLRRFRTIL